MRRDPPSDIPPGAFVPPRAPGEAPSAAPIPAACKRVMAVISPRPTWDDGLCRAVETRFGPIDYRAPFLPFEDDGYYAPEMGAPLWRGWLSFRGLADPAGLPAWKHAARAVEDEFRRDGRRMWNLDIGYMDPDKLVLASLKRGPFKLYLGGDVWADMILGYSRGLFTPMAWAFPDFRDGRYDKSLRVIRDKLKAETRR